MPEPSQSHQPNWQTFIPPPPPASGFTSRSASGDSSTENKSRLPNLKTSTLENYPARKASTSDSTSPASSHSPLTIHALDQISPITSKSVSTPPLSSDRHPTDDGGKKPFSTYADKHKSMAVLPGNNSNVSAIPPVEDESLNPIAPSTTGSSGNSKRRQKQCYTCKLPISGHFVRALNNLYHMECFTCFECKKPCSAKFFPVEAPSNNTEVGNTIPLCEHCYFKRQDLLCCSCDGALRGSYITALGKKYHVEHFTCSLCSVVFGSDDSYYEHEDNIYCRYHYSTLYAAKCEGCKTAILKQFVEVFRGGREQQWHPECYMINKFWNVMMSPDRPSVYPAEIPSGDEESSNNSPPGQVVIDRRPSDEYKKLMVSPDAESREAVLRVEQVAEEKSFHIWSILCGYEEATAACISDMLQYASSRRYHETLLATARLVAKIEVLLSAIDIISADIDPLLRAVVENDGNSKEEQEEESPEFKNLIEIVRKAGFTQLRKEPKTLCKKVVSFMSLLSKSRERNVRGPGPSQELLDSVTSMAHYLKLLIRHGLSNSLRYDRAFSSGKAIAKFLDQVSTHDQIPANPLESLGVSGKADDRCLHCNNSMEDDCASLDGKRWHLDCLHCRRCQAPLGSRVKDARYQSKEKIIICVSCLRPTDEFRGDFIIVTKLHQFIYLVKIALARLKLLLDTYDARDRAAAAAAAGDSEGNRLKTSLQLSAGVTASAVVSDSRPSLQATRSTSSRRPSAEPLPNEARKNSATDQGYMTTLKDIRKLRSSRLSKQLSESSHRARRSRILDMPPSEQGLFGKNDSSSSLPPAREGVATVEHNEPPPVPAKPARPYSNKTTGITERTHSPPPNHFSSIDNQGSVSPKTQKQSFTSQSEILSPMSSPKPHRRPGFIKRMGSQKRGRNFKIEEDPKSSYNQLGRTTDLIKNEKSLILDDIPRIVAAEQARELRPNAFRHRRQEISQEDEVHVVDFHEKRAMSERYMSELTPLELFYVRHIAISLIQPLVSQWFTMEELMEMIETRKAPSLWEKFGKAFSLNGGGGSTSDPKNKKKTGVFGVSLDQQVEKFGVDSTFGVGVTPLRIPAFVDECISAMRQMDMSVEGIFRKNGNIRRSKELAEMADKNPGKTGMFTDENPIQLAALFKKYLRELPDSLMTFKLQKIWLTSQEIADAEERSKLMHLICCLLPTAHRDVMEVLFYFLYWTSSFSRIDDESGSKMDIHNLSTVITPNILYAKRKENAPPEASEGYFLAIEAVDVLIKEYDRFAKVPLRVLSILSNLDVSSMAELPSTDVLLKIQNFIEMPEAPQAQEVLAQNQQQQQQFQGSSTGSVPIPHIELPRAAAVKTSVELPSALNGAPRGNPAMKQAHNIHSSLVQ